MLKIDGQCHCGFVAYEAEIDADNVVICHCTDCQRLTGSPFRVTAFAATRDVKLTANAPRVYTRKGDNGRLRYQQFCPECGSPVFTTGEGDDASLTGIRWGSINQRAALKPRGQYWCRSSVDWIADIAKLPASQGD